MCKKGRKKSCARERQGDRESRRRNPIRQFNMEMPLVHISLVNELPSCITDEMAGETQKNFSVSQDQKGKSGPAVRRKRTHIIKLSRKVLRNKSSVVLKRLKGVSFSLCYWFL